MSQICLCNICDCKINEDLSYQCSYCDQIVCLFDAKEIKNKYVCKQCFNNKFKMCNICKNTLQINFETFKVCKTVGCYNFICNECILYCRRCSNEIPGICEYCFRTKHHKDCKICSGLSCVNLQCKNCGKYLCIKHKVHIFRKRNNGTLLNKIKSLTFCEKCYENLNNGLKEYFINEVMNIVLEYF